MAITGVQRGHGFSWPCPVGRTPRRKDDGGRPGVVSTGLDKRLVSNALIRMAKLITPLRVRSSRAPLLWCLIFRYDILPLASCHLAWFLMCGELSERVKRQLGAAVRVLRGGGLVAFPTDTVYGLGGDAFRVSAVTRVYEVKHRPRHMPLPLLLADIGQLDSVAAPVSEVARLLARRFWPGGLTLVVRSRGTVPDIVTAGGEGVAVRVPDHPVPIFLARALGRPLVGTSANISGMPSCRTAAEVRRQLDDGVDMIIEGECSGGVESTVVDVTTEVPVVVREGAVSKESIIRVCSEAGHAHSVGL
ncbi:MAG: L-threonylcarbamoyladenylate synthase [Chloroflexota bacterium]